MDCSPPGSSVPEDSPGKNTGVGCCALQEIFQTQGSKAILHHCNFSLKVLLQAPNTFLPQSTGLYFSLLF